MADEGAKIKLTKSHSCSKLPQPSPSLMKKGVGRQRQSGPNQQRSGPRRGPHASGPTSLPIIEGCKLNGELNNPDINELNSKAISSELNTKSINEVKNEGILKALKDLEWEVSEIISEKMPNLVELGCSVGEPDELHRQLIHVNQKLLESLKATVKELESRTNALLAEKISLEARTHNLMTDKLDLEDKLENTIEECNQLRDNRVELQQEISRLREEKQQNSDDKKKDVRNPAGSKASYFDPTSFGFGAIETRASLENEVDDFGEPVRWSSTEDMPALAPAKPFSEMSDPSLGTRLSELAYREELRQMNRLKELEEEKLKENSIIKELREEISVLKKWKESAIIETVDKDRLLADMEQQIVDIQREYDESKEECLGHQKVIQELKASLEQKSHLNSTMEAHMSTGGGGGWSSGSRPSTRTGGAMGAMGGGTTMDFQSCFARTLEVNGPDRLSWLEQELLKARQRYIQTEADLERLNQSHWALLEEYGRLQEDFRSLHHSVRTGSSNQAQMISDRLERDVSVLRDTISSLRDELKNKDSLIEDLHRQCESYESKFDVIQNVEYIRDLQRDMKDKEEQILHMSDTIENLRRALDDDH